ncbi:MAG: HD-GYP domain-containing protein [Zoogloeaceae bacterium]|jgi:HD-GYP domain-containing protein (c-di-GMP phosphodiesterase class II)|nr:HD-GYP domain-containing protein [Zoogloeaceae bacterium]
MMTKISSAILWRLALAVVLALFLAGTGFYFIMERSLDDFVLTLSEPQADEIANAKVDQGDEAIYAKVLEVVFRRSVSAQMYDNEWNLRKETTNPRYDAQRAELMAKMQDFPRDTARYRHIIRTADMMVAHIQVPILNAAKEQIGILNGVFVVPRWIDQQLRQDFRYALLMVAAAILLTAALFYPMILSLNRKVLHSSHEVLRGNLEMAETLGTAIAKRDSDTGTHNYRVCYYALQLGIAAKLSNDEIRRLILGSFFHDIGKIGISDALLLKPGKLTEEEFAVMKEHVSLGLEIVRPSRWLSAGRDVIEYHHERVDGAGYLKQLKGEEIPLVARIFAIVDVFDALASRRPYKEPMPSEEAIAIVREEADNHFDPHLVDLFSGMAVRLYKEVTQLDKEQLSKMLLQKISYYFLMPDKIPLMP